MTAGGLVRAAGAALAALGAILSLAACATAYPPAQGASRVPSAPPGPFPPTPAPPEALIPVQALPGWASDDHAAAYDAFRETCGAARDPAMAVVCREARAIGPLTARQAGAFFEAHFQVAAYPGAGVLTGYFAPEYQARHAPDAEFSAPVRPKPGDPLMLGADRAAIEALPAEDALAWMRPEDLFFLQVQGSGVLTFEDGRRVKALYAANNGKPFVAIAGPMRQMGLLPGNDTSGEAIRAWLAAHRGPEAQGVMQLDPRYAFFRLVPDDGRPPVGSANVPLPPGRSLAVDPALHAMGELLWIDGEAPILTGAFPTYRRLALALDTGGAIKGEVRADLYVGQGAVAGAEAGRIRHTLRLYRLVPR